jgi:hypothetical protein
MRINHPERHRLYRDDSLGGRAAVKHFVFEYDTGTKKTVSMVQYDDYDTAVKRCSELSEHKTDNIEVIVTSAESLEELRRESRQ